MSKRIPANGQCLCGAVTIKANEVSTHAGACHCDSCRKWTGGPLLTVDCGTDVEISGQKHVGVYDSSDWADRGFCKQCGSGLFYRLKHSGQYIMPIGLFDIESKLVFDHQVFIDVKPEYYCFSNKTKDMTGEEMFAQYGGE